MSMCPSAKHREWATDMKEIRSKKAFTAHTATYATDESDRYMTKHAKADFAL